MIPLAIFVVVTLATWLGAASEDDTTSPTLLSLVTGTVATLVYLMWYYIEYHE